MVSGYFAHDGHYLRSSAQLQKERVRAGTILWLRKKVDGNDLKLLRAAGLQEWNMNHPAVVIDVLEGRPSDVQICLITSCGNKNITQSPIPQNVWSFYLPLRPAPPHPELYGEPLCLENNAGMRKNSYVDTQHDFLTSLVLLQKFETNGTINSHCLTPESLDRVRLARCLPSLLPSSLSKRPAVIKAAANVYPAPSQPFSTRPINPCSNEAHPRYVVQDMPPPYRQLEPEQQPLIAATRASSRSQSFRSPALPSTHWQLPERCNFRRTHYYHMQEERNMAVCWVILRTLLISVLLCICTMLVGLLGYALFLGLAWLVRAFIALLVTIKGDFVSFGHYIARLGRVIASPFVAVRNEIVPALRSVGHLLKAIVQWVRELMGQI